MKKILFGLAAMSTLAFSAGPVLTDSPVTETNIFQPGINQTGKITVNGSFTTTVPVVKYVVYASTSDTYDGTSESTTLELPAFILSDNALSNEFESGDIPKIYVKKINTSEDGVEDLQNETVTFELGLDTTATSNVPNYTLEEGKSYAPYPTELLGNTELRTIVSTIGSGLTLKEDRAYLYTGSISSPKYWVTPKNISFVHTTNGILEVSLVNSSIYNNGNGSIITDTALWNKVALTFNGKSFTFDIKVIVK